MTPGELLTQLQQTFPAGRTSGFFDASRVAGGAYEALLAGLGIPAQLALSSPIGWQLQGNTITLDGEVTTAVLAVADVPVFFQFTQSGEDFILLIDLALPAAWTFGQSFALLDIGILPQLSLKDPLTQQSALIIASGQTQDPKRLVDAAPLPVGRGLSFFGFFDTNSSPLTQIAWILNDGALGAVSGPIDYDAAKGTVSMDLPLARGSISSLFGDSGPTFSLSLTLHSGLDERLDLYVSGIQLKTEIDFATTDGSKTLELSALLSTPRQGVLDLTISGTALAFPTPATLARYFGASNGIADNLPDQFQGGNLVEINAIVFGIGLRSHSLEYAWLSIGALTGESWPIWPGVIELGDLSFQSGVFQPFIPGSTTYSFTFSGVVTLGQVPILVQATLPGEVLTGQLGTDTPLSLVPLVQEIFGFTNGLPESLVISRLDFSADIPESAYSIDLDIDGEWAFTFGTGNRVVFEELSLSLSYSEGTPTGMLSGKFAVNSNTFTLTFELTEGNTTFRGEWQREGKPLSYWDIAMALGMYGLPALPEGLDLNLERAVFQFGSAKPTFLFELESSSYGKAALVTGKSTTGAWGFIFGMIVGLDLSVDLTQIDVIGKLVPSGLDFIALKGLRVVGATSALPEFVLSDELSEIFGGQVNSGLVLATQLQVGTAVSEDFTVRFGGLDDGSQWDTPPGEDPPAQPARSALVPTALASDASTTQPAPTATWLNVQRAFGPLQINRIGFAITPENSLGFLMDARVELAGLRIGLRELEADIPIRAPYTPSFALAGLQVNYSAGGLVIAGGLGKVPGKTPVQYDGDLTVTVGDFGLTALGSYTTVDGQPSLFVYAVLKAPLGGPPCFFVTGLAGGFGYNRTLTLPTIDQVATYPLVQAATGALEPDKLLPALGQYIQPAANENWFAAGVRFTSFEMLKSFALLTASFGTRTEFGLMGSSFLSVPVSTPDAKEPALAQAEMVLLVDVAPASGQLAVNAQLTDRSYVLDPAAKLTGGFAFYLWFGDNPHAGDFVVTLGGYNPYFVRPEHYPSVPRLGLNWRVSDELSIKGGLYFALTPAVIMAGGSLDATWQSSDLKAWYHAEADFLIRFKPFQYRLHVQVNVGATFSLNLWLTTKVITVHVGVGLDLWGPAFGGTARIDLSILSVTLSFGAPEPVEKKEISWSEFRRSFLPPANAAERNPQGPVAPSLLAEPEPTLTDTLITTSAPSGLLGTLEDGTWQVDPAALQLVVAAQIPSKAAAVITASSQAPQGTWNTEFGIGPMGVAPGDLEVALDISIRRDSSPDDDTWEPSAVTGSVPAGLWLNTTSSLQSAALVSDVLTGVALVPRPPTPDTVLPIPLSKLLDGSARAPRDFAWSSTDVPTTDPYDQTTAMQTLQQTLVDPDVTATRSAILGALQLQGLSTASTVDVMAFANTAPNLLFSAPRLSLLGEAR